MAEYYKLQRFNAYTDIEITVMCGTYEECIRHMLNTISQKTELDDGNYYTIKLMGWDEMNRHLLGWVAENTEDAEDTEDGNRMMTFEETLDLLEAL